ncbi:MAG: carboxylating nicotinate-nucleotide diphosphorylase [Desulfovibrio sp.]|nr:carboxylating nicotinate-nucleotide diphosphorylase [Desulfovibrio sp.]
MQKKWSDYFSEHALAFVKKNIALALAEDGAELTAEGIFSPTANLQAIVRAKEASMVVGLPLIDLVLQSMQATYSAQFFVSEGSTVPAMTNVAKIEGKAIDLLKAERVILNYICHLSGIANLTHTYVEQVAGTNVRILDTRKTTPGLRWLEKYAVWMGGATNHRMDLASMLMLKDNHIDAAGSITACVEKLRSAYHPCPPIEVECRTLKDVQEAMAAKCERIMLDNMSPAQIKSALDIIPESFEVEISGGVHLENLRELATIGPRHADFISVGRLTHSAKAADFSMLLQ